MSLKEKIKQLNKRASVIRESIRDLNISAADLSGVAAVIPQDALFQASYFKGHKVILHNVSYDYNAGLISATITFPDTEGAGCSLSRGTYQVNIDETWFE